jgi:chaperonin GroEL
VVLSRVCAEKGESFGYNAETDTYGDLVKEGVIDPAKVTRIALQNAASIAGLMLTTEALIAEIPERQKTPASPHADEMGGGMY